MKTSLNYIALILLLCTSCSDTNDTSNDFSFLTEKESYSIEISGTHPTLTDINSNIKILKDDVILGGNKITLIAKEGVGSRDLTIIINIPADESASGKKESIGIYLYNNDETDIWNVTDKYQLTNIPSISRRASLDYIIEDNEFYNDTRNFSDRIYITVKDNRLTGSFDRISTKFYGSNNSAIISGTFDADLTRLNQ